MLFITYITKIRGHTTTKIRGSVPLHCGWHAGVSVGTWLQQTDFTSLGRCTVIVRRRWCLVLCSVVMCCLAVASGCRLHVSIPRYYLVLRFLVLHFQSTHMYCTRVCASSKQASEFMYNRKHFGLSGSLHVRYTLYAMYL